MRTVTFGFSAASSQGWTAPEDLVLQSAYGSTGFVISPLPGLAYAGTLTPASNYISDPAITLFALTASPNTRNILQKIPVLKGETIYVSAAAQGIVLLEFEKSIPN
jgi:hypothetical protein